MTVIRFFIMCLCMTLLPYGIGSGVMRKEMRAERSKLENMILGWVIGQMILWVLFFFVCVPMILMKLNFSDVLRGYGGIALVLFAMAAIKNLSGHKKNRSERKKETKKKVGDIGLIARMLWVLAALLFVLQMVAVFALAYEEGDDAYYVAITTMSRDADRLYTKLPYTGAFTELTARYALAPFPVWVAVLAKIGDLSGAVTSHLVMPVFVICMSYGIFYLTGKKLLCLGENEKQDWRMPFYLSLMELLVIFGGYSTYSRENFLLVRAAQGKAVLANVIIPFLFYLLFVVFDQLEQDKKIGCDIWLLLSGVLISGCLCSTLGSFLLCMLLGLGMLCGALAYHRWKILLGLLPCMIAPAVVVLMYLKL